MILVAEYGLHFAKDGDRWRCVEWPGLTMQGDRYEVEDGENLPQFCHSSTQKQAPTTTADNRQHLQNTVA